MLNQPYWSVRLIGVTTLLVVTVPWSMRSQAAQQQVPPAATSSSAAPTEADKQKALQADADRLAKLAEELETSLKHTRRDELSVKVVVTADEMERLARSARTRIR